MQLNAVDQAFHETYNALLEEGHLKHNRTGVDTLMLPAMSMKFDLRGGSQPWLTTKELREKKAREEMFWFVSGSSSIKFLRDRKNGIWDNWFVPGTAVYDETAAPVSLKMRLSRVSKNRKAMWDEINASLVKDPMIDWDGETTPVTVFRGGKFIDMSLDHGQVISVTKLLDSLRVPKYPLLDADIGPGGYGPQWRSWKDTQLVDADQVKAYEAQGYQYVTRVAENEDFYDKVVMHREIDQLQTCINMLRSNPDDRRMLVTAWNPGLTWKAALPPCHLYFQFMTSYRTGAEIYKSLVDADKWDKLVEHYAAIDMDLTKEEFIDLLDTSPESREVTEQLFNTPAWKIPVRHLHCLLVMRSSDTPLGLPFNVAQYSMLVNMVAHVTNMEAASLTWIGGDTHIYVNQIDAIKTQLSRESMPDSDVRLTFARQVEELDDLVPEDLIFTGYEHRGFLEIPVAV